MSEPHDSAVDIPVATLLLILAGYIDAIAFIVLKGSFVSFMSGNTTIVGASLADHSWSVVALTGGLIGLFVAGAMCGAIITRCTPRHPLRWVLAAVTVTLACATVIATMLAHTPGMLVAAVAAGMINSSLSASTPVKGGLTYVTGTLVLSAHQFVNGWGTDRRWDWVRTFWTWPVFLVGAAAGGYAHHIAGIAALWCAVAWAALALGVRIWHRPRVRVAIPR